MADPNIVVNMSEAVNQRLHPAVTRWNRLEGRPRTHHFDRALWAEEHLLEHVEDIHSRHDHAKGRDGCVPGVVDGG